MDQGTGETAIMTAVSFHAREVDGKTGSVLLLLMSSQLLTAWQQLPKPISVLALLAQRMSTD